MLADSSVVTIAPPENFAQYECGGPHALVGADVVQPRAAGALPAAYAARRRPAAVFACGGRRLRGRLALVRAGASFDARRRPGVRGHAARPSSRGRSTCSSPRATGSEEVAGRRWALAGIVGAAVGPAAGGVLTQLVGWEAIFVVQALLVLLALAAASGVQPAVPTAPAQRLDVAVLASYAVSAALVAPLFLLVVLLINGWRVEPFGGRPRACDPLARCSPSGSGGGGARVGPGRGRGDPRHRRPGGSRAAGGGRRVDDSAATLVGAGLGLAVASLTERALTERSPQAIHAGWTIAARHAGIVVGLALLTPAFAADLEGTEDDALAAGTAAVLDSHISPLQKLSVARDAARGGRGAR